MTGRMWTLVIVAPCVWLTANDRRNIHAQARLVKHWRVAAFAAAHVNRLPTGLARVRIDAEARFRGRPPVRDVDNLRATLKAVIDGLGPERHHRLKSGQLRHAVGHGLIPDDDDKHLDGPYLTIGPPLCRDPHRAPGELILTIKEITCDEDKA